MHLHLSLHPITTEAELLQPLWLIIMELIALDKTVEVTQKNGIRRGGDALD
jgi:hypothetical protein